MKRIIRLSFAVSIISKSETRNFRLSVTADANFFSNIKNSEISFPWFWFIGLSKQKIVLMFVYAVSSLLLIFAKHRNGCLFFLTASKDAKFTRPSWLLMFLEEYVARQVEDLCKSSVHSRVSENVLLRALWTCPRLRIWPLLCVSRMH